MEILEKPALLGPENEQLVNFMYSEVKNDDESMVRKKMTLQLSHQSMMFNE